MAFQRTTTEILADLTIARTARTTLLSGEQVTDVWEDGQRIKMSGMTLEQIDASIASLEREYQQAVAVEAGSPRRRGIGLAWNN